MTNNTQPTRDDLADRLMDLALSEKLGGKQPPDLSAEILARAQEKASLPETRRAEQPAPTRGSYVPVAVSACLLAIAALGAVIIQPDVTARLASTGGDGSLLAAFEKEKSRFVQPIASQTAIRDKEKGFYAALELVDVASVPFPDDPPIVYPDAEVWEELTLRRKKYASMDAGLVDGMSNTVTLWNGQQRHDASRGRTTDSLRMIVTPRISVQEEGFAPSFHRRALSGPVFASNIAAKIDAEVIAVSSRGKLLELSLGSDDGLSVNHVLDVYRNGKYLGGVKVLKTSPDRAVAQVAVLFDGGLILKGDKVVAPFDPPGKDENPAEPDPSGDKFDLLPENEFEKVKGAPLSTFSIDVDTASYSKVRQFLVQANQLPPAEAVRLEELINYFPYGYAPPADDERPFAAHVEVADCPWKPEYRLVRIGLKGKVIEEAQRPPCNLVFLVDVSGSMDEPNRLPLVIHGLKMLAGELTERDRVSIVVYAGAAGMVLPPTPGDAKPTIFTALAQLKAGGSTNGGEGIELAYKTAQENFIDGGVNRVILCTDGDFNVGVTSTGQLVDLAKEKAQKGVFLSVLGFGMGNHNDEMLEAVSGKANGNYAFIDSLSEARKVLVRQISGTLVTIAKDVKIQVEFNPAKVASYRLLGYENRMLAAEDFNDDKKDAGEIGGGHTVTALYEIVPLGAAEKPVETTPTRSASEAATLTRSASEGTIDELKYQPEGKSVSVAAAQELLTLKLRYKQPEGETSAKLEFPVKDASRRFTDATPDFQFAASVASFGMLLRHSRFKGDASFDAVAEIAAAAKGEDPHGYRAEFIELVKKAKELSKTK